MKFIDTYDGRVFSMMNLYTDYQEFRKADPVNHADSFRAELYEILMATINGRNDLDVVGFTPRELSRFTLSLREKLNNETEA